MDNNAEKLSEEALSNSIVAYIDHLGAERRHSDHTIAAYQRDLKHLLQFATENSLQSWRGLSVKHARLYPAQLNRSGLAGSSIQRMLSAARNFFRFLLHQQQLESNAFETVSAPKSKKKLPITLSVDEMSQLLERHDGSVEQIRDRAMLELFYSSGLRLSELSTLNLDTWKTEVSQSSSEVKVTGKGNKQRIVPVGEKALEALREWTAVRGQLALGGETALFVNRQGKRITNRGIQYRIEAWAKRNGLGRHVHPHMLRHSFASHVLESSGDLRSVQEMLGHADISTTQIYTHLDFQHLAKVYDNAHPRAKRKSN